MQQRWLRLLEDLSQIKMKLTDLIWNTSTRMIALLIGLFLVGCGQNAAEKKLLGRWVETQNEQIVWRFYPDSLIITEDPFIKVEWEATSSKIRVDYPKYVWDSTGKPRDTIDHIVIDYKLSKNRDTLMGTLTNLHGIHEFGLIRTKN